MHPLEQKITSLRTRLRRLLTLYGVSRVVGVVVTMVLALGMVDYLVRLEDRGLRVIATLILLGALAWSGYRFLYLGLAARLRDVDLARRVQRRFPALEDELASAVEFLHQAEDDPIAGSVALRRAVITEAAARTERLDFREAIQERPAWRATVTASAVTVLAAIVLVAFPAASGIALARLANPFGNVAWPQVNHLALRQPVKPVPRGEAFEVEVIDARGEKLPSEVRIHYRFDNPDGSATQESELMRFLGGAMIARRENVTRPFWFRFEGGDCRPVGWHRVEVVDPPAVESMSVRLVPPAYTGWPAETADRNFRALAGTVVEISARATKPLLAALLCLEDGRQIPARLADDGYGFTIPASPPALVVEKSGSYWFRLTDPEEYTGGDSTRWEIRAVPDAPPQVTVEQPSTNVFVTSRAVVPIRIVAQDDLAVRRIDLEFSRSDQANRPEKEPPGEAGEWRGSGAKTESVLPIYAGPPQAPSSPGGLAAALAAGEGRVAAPYEWPLEGLNVQPGTQLTFRAAATDYRPQTGRSEPRQLTVVTPEDMAERIAARQALILAELSRVLEIQRASRSQVMEREVRTGRVGPLGQLDLDHLRGAELNQRQATQTLTSRSEGVPAHVLGLLADLANNKIDSPDVQRRMEQLLTEIERLAREELPAIGRDLTAAIKGIEIRLDKPPYDANPPQPDPSDAAVGRALAAAGKNQERVILSLEQMIAELGRWDRFRQFHREVAQLLRDQQESAQQTAEVGRRTMTRDPRDLSPQDAADLDVRSRQQVLLALRLEGIQMRMEQAAGPLRESDPLAAQTVADALDRARELDVAGRMRSAAGQLQRNQMGQALAAQRQVEENLRELLDILANRREDELVRLTKKYQEAAADLAEIARREEDLQKQFQQAAGQKDAEQAKRDLQSLSAEQEKLREQTERTARRLEQLVAQDAAEKTRQGAKKMGQAGQSAGQGQGGEAARRAQQARQDIDEARRRLEDRQRQAEAELAQQQLARLQDTLQSLDRRQQQALEETRRLDGLQRTQSSLTPGQEASLGDLAREQQLLQNETAALAEKLAAAKVFAVALASAGREMAVAAGLLARRQTADSTQQAEQAALDRFSQVLEALKPDPPEEKPDEKQEGQGGQGGQGGTPPAPRPAGIPEVAQIKLLKLLQEDLNRRTQAMEKTLSLGGQAAADARRRIHELSLEQGRLAGLLMSLIPVPQEKENPP